MSAKNLDSVRTMVARVLKEMEEESRLAGKAFSLDKVNLSEFQRRSGLSRQRVRTLARHGFTVRQNGNTGRRKVSVLSGYEPKVDELLVAGSHEFLGNPGEAKGNGVPWRPDDHKDVRQRPPRSRASPAGEPGQTVRDGTRRVFPDGLGIRQCRR